MGVIKAIRKRLRWYYPFSALAIIPAYIFVIRPVRVLLNYTVMVPFLQYLHRRDSSVQVAGDEAGTGILLESAGTDLAVTIAIPGGYVFFAFLFVLLLMTARLRFMVMLAAIHIGAFLVAVLAAALAAYSTALLLHMVPLFQHYLVLAASFSILFFSLRDLQ
ncbi:MAG: hypothetical protein EA363_13255 [Balneolaceae bacterium]|nr:MAG: hypothetical protein EA363_13255 [Balneolaceae bacterium]